MAQSRLSFGPAGQKREREEEDDELRNQRPRLHAQPRQPLQELAPNAAGGALAGPGRPLINSGPYLGYPVAKKGSAVNDLLGVGGERRPRGPPKKSGLQRLKDKSLVVKGTATVKSNPIARHLGLGDCKLAAPPSQDRGTNGRPYEKVGGKNFLTYHLTWAASNGKIPAVTESGATEYSHRCHRKMCIEEKHGVWETGTQNKARAVCDGGRSHQKVDGEWVTKCPHDPSCLSGAE